MKTLEDLATEEVFSIWKNIIRDIFINSFSNKPTAHNYQPDLIVKTNKARRLFQMFRTNYENLSVEQLEYLEGLRNDTTNDSGNY